jgi:geranylgeranyl pyrophosphate synthase
VIDQNLRPGADVTPDLSEFAHRLAMKYSGYFETGRRAMHRYRLGWQVLESTFHNERPLFDLFRRSVFCPEGIGASYPGAAAQDVSPLIMRPTVRLRADLMTIGEVLIDTIRLDWPFLVSVMNAGPIECGIAFRPALFLLLAASFGSPRESLLILAGAAVELGYLAAQLQHSVMDEQEESAMSNKNRAANRGNAFAVMVVDFLLSKAYELSAKGGARASYRVAEALGWATEGRVRETRNAHNPELTEAEHLDILGFKTGTLFELPCRLGAELSGASAAHVDALASYGRCLGVAHQLADEALHLSGEPGWSREAMDVELRDGVYGLPVRRVLQKGGVTARQLQTLLGEGPLSANDISAVLKLVRDSGAIAETLGVAREYAAKAQAALETLPESPARMSLCRLAEYAAVRTAPKPPDLGDLSN